MSLLANLVTFIPNASNSRCFGHGFLYHLNYGYFHQFQWSFIEHDNKNLQYKVIPDVVF